MKKIIFVVLVAVFIFTVLRFFNPAEQEIELANPASANCQDQGGRLEKAEFESGETFFCFFEDGSQCEEWDFFTGACDKGDLKIETLKAGTGRRAEKGDEVTVHYVGMLENETQFDSSIGKTPFSFVLGEGKVISGWEQGVFGMQAGEIRKITVSPNLGYGKTGVSGVIPPDSVLIFEVEVLEIK